MSLHIEHFQYSLGDPPGRPPEHFGYLAAHGHECYTAAPFSSAPARTRYEEATVRFLTLDGVVLQVAEVPPFAVAALVILTLEGPAQDEFATPHLERLGITARTLDDLRTLADTIIVGLPTV